MVDLLTIWVRQGLADINERIRELFRRQIRKLIELVLTDTDLMARLRDAASMLGEIAIKDGLHLEFGVYKGDSINRFAGLSPDVIWYGFDSFEGLPEAWTLGAKKGAFSVGGRLPPVRSNVRLIKGFFEDTLPGFIGEHRGAKIALMHVDCDLYSATKTIFANVADMLAPGTIIIFDELINYHGGREVGEFKAFMEFTAERKLSFEYVAYNRTGSQVAVRILDVTAPTK
ncbi:MAG: class I SAM-dependent methyltransferase [Pseudolabrys sp.]|jgi:hypothetical protein